MQNKIDIIFSFEKEVMKKLGIRNKLLNRNNKYSATLVACDIYTEEEMNSCLLTK